MIRVKPGVQLSDVQAIAVLINVAESVYRDHGLNCRITSGIDRPATRVGMGLHPKGRALDFGIKDHAWAVLPADLVENIAAEMRQALGRDFDVVVELDKVHIHVEYDPK